jgi:hypothetical protein
LAVSPHCIQFVQDPTELIEAIKNFMVSEERWSQASQNARDFAVKNMSIDVVRHRIYKALENAHCGFIEGI